MNEQIIEAMGKLNSDIIEADDICHDSVQFVVDGLKESKGFGAPSEYMEYKRAIGQLCSESGTLLHKATALQKTEAILKAKGLWVDAMEGGAMSEKRTEFETWWRNEASAPKLDGEEWERFVYRTCKVAWYNGAFCARKIKEDGR